MSRNFVKQFKNRLSLALLSLVFSATFTSVSSASEVEFDIHGMIQVWVESIDNENVQESSGTRNKRTEIALVSSNEGAVSWVLMFDLAGGGGKEAQSFLQARHLGIGSPHQ